MTYGDKTKEQLIQEVEMLRARVKELEAAEAERTRVEEALVQQQYLMRALMDNSPDHIYFKDTQSRFIRMSKSQSDRFGLSDPAQAVGKTDFDFFTEEHARQAYEDEQRIIQTGQPVTREELETWAGRPDTWVLTTKLPLRDEAGNIVGVFGISKEITERKRAEEALKESQERYRTLFEDSPVSLWEEDFSAAKTYIDRLRRAGVQDLRNYFKNHPEAVMQCADMVRVVDVNKATVEWHHVANKEALQGNLSRLLSPEGCEDIKEELMGLVEGGTRYELASARHDRAGNPLYLIVTGTVAPGYEDSWGRVLVSVLDITKLKLAEEALRERESALDSILRAAPTGIGLVSNRVLLKVNQRICEMVGRTQEELIGKNARILYPTDAEYEYVGSEKYHQIAEQGIGTVETRWQHKNGTVIDVLMSSVPLDPKDLSAGVTFTALDITERKRAEEALRESEEKYRSIVETTTEWIWEIDLTGRHTFSNPGVTAILGYRPEEFIGQIAVSLLHAEDRLEVETTLPRLIAEKRGWRGWVLRWRHKDGSYRYLESNASPIIDAAGELVGYLGADRDITERKRAEAQLNEQLDELRRWHKATLGRETRILDLKREVNELLAQVGKPPRYPSAETENQ